MANPEREVSQEAILGLFFPYAHAEIERAKRENIRFAHYTSAAVALEIIRNQDVWLRRSTLMNDFSEIQHGEKCLAKAWHDENLGSRVNAILNRVEKGLATKFAETWDSHGPSRRRDTFMLSISEHGDRQGYEDKYGRLSMWRAYGGQTNVAIVMNNRPFVSPSDAVKAYTSPVLYRNVDEFALEFERVLVNLENNIETLKKIGSDEVLNRLFWAFHFAALSTKHPGFSEEREWRVVYSPSLNPSQKILDDVQVVNGIPQRIYKLKLENHPDEGLIGATLPELLEEIIIGPTEDPYPIYDALVMELKKAGVPEPQSKVSRSEIPLRR